MFESSGKISLAMLLNIGIIKIISWVHNHNGSTVILLQGDRCFRFWFIKGVC